VSTPRPGAELVSPIYLHYYALKIKLVQFIFALRSFWREKHVSDNSQVLDEKLIFAMSRLLILGAQDRRGNAR
jgi:hypothetical protein